MFELVTPTWYSTLSASGGRVAPGRGRRRKGSGCSTKKMWVCSTARWTVPGSNSELKCR
jgi:hypothetical protein